MNIAIVYVLPMCAGERYFDYALRFIESYYKFPPLADHNTIIALNGGKLNDDVKWLFSTFPNRQFLEHDNSGFDIGAYQLAAKTVACDLMVFLGVSTYFKGRGWLQRIIQSYEKHGNALYGVMGNNGDSNVNVYPHIRTTGFWMSPSLLNEYPIRVKTNEQRYEFEHGKCCLSEWVKHNNKHVWVVTWDGEYEWPDWDSIPNGFHRGDQSALLMGDHISEPPFYHIP